MRNRLHYFPLAAALAICAFAGDKLSGNSTWTGSNTAGNKTYEITSNATGTYITVYITQVVEGVTITTSLGCALNTAGTAYATPGGGEIEFDDVVNGNDKAYNLKISNDANGHDDTGLVSKP